MRDVTDNRTAELPVGESKRGRGRPPKANALTNAERQAAYRARRKNVVTVTEKPGMFRGEQLHQDVGGLEDAMAELRAELDATKAELAEAHGTIDEMTDELARMRRQRNEAAAVSGKLQAELAAARKGAEKSVTGNDYSEALALVIPLVGRLCRDLTQDQRCELHQSTLMDRITACPEWSVQQFKELSEAVIGEAVVRAKNKSVTRKRVTKKTA